MLCCSCVKCEKSGLNPDLPTFELFFLWLQNSKSYRVYLSKSFVKISHYTLHKCLEGHTLVLRLYQHDALADCFHCEQDKAWSCGTVSNPSSELRPSTVFMTGLIQLFIFRYLKVKPEHLEYTLQTTAIMAVIWKHQDVSHIFIMFLIWIILFYYWQQDDVLMMMYQSCIIN